MCRGENPLGFAQQVFYTKVVIPLQWTAWSEFTPCSKTCGNGTQYRKRFCVLPTGKLVQNDDYKCNGENLEFRNCYILPCPVNGGWSRWTPWSEDNCKINCINDTVGERPVKKRYRKCDSPEPSMGGKPCLGANWEEQDCENIPLCPVDGDWTEWGEWTDCTKSCGIGMTSRSRSCTNPYPRNGGKHCDGMYVDIKYCNMNPCPINGGWGSWTNWSPCSKTCGKGLQMRKRFCNNPEPVYGGKDCAGENIEYQECNMRNCININRNWLKSLDNDHSEENFDKFGAHVEFEVDSRSKDENVRDSNQFIHKSRSQFDYLDQKDLEYYGKNANEKKVNPQNPKITVSVDSYRPISEETYNSLVNGNAKPPIETLEFEEDTSDNLSIEDEYGDESNAEFFSQEVDDSPQYEQRNCQVGFYYNHQNDQCDDINECLLVTTKCPVQSKCVNLPGGYRCQCRYGFTFIAGKCLDVNECSVGHKCSHTCENLVGSYRCKCPEGMTLGRNKVTCVFMESKRRIREEQSNKLETCESGYVMEGNRCLGKRFK